MSTSLSSFLYLCDNGGFPVVQNAFLQDAFLGLSQAHLFDGQKTFKISKDIFANSLQMTIEEGSWF
jgi:hypothetical protein